MFFFYQHVFRTLDWLESNKGDLHRKDRSQRVHGAVGDIDAVGETSCQNQRQDMQWDQVDQEHISSPRRNLPTRAFLLNSLQIGWEGNLTM